ncbi:hypothetical protein M5D96_011885, partial [Drosophila gunungcola]
YQCRVRKFNKKQARFYASQVALALECMHKMHLMHRRVDGRTSALCGSPEYLAPEIVQIRPYIPSEFLYQCLRLQDAQLFYCPAKHLVESLMQVDTSKRLGNSPEGAIDVNSHPSGAEDLSNFENFQFKDRLKSRINRHPDLFSNF